MADDDAIQALLGYPQAPKGIPASLADAIAEWAEEAAERGDE